MKPHIAKDVDHVIDAAELIHAEVVLLLGIVRPRAWAGLKKRLIGLHVTYTKHPPLLIGLILVTSAGIGRFSMTALEADRSISSLMGHLYPAADQLIRKGQKASDL